MFPCHSHERLCFELGVGECFHATLNGRLCFELGVGECVQCQSQ